MKALTNALKHRKPAAIAAVVLAGTGMAGIGVLISRATQPEQKEGSLLDVEYRTMGDTLENSTLHPGGTSPGEVQDPAKQLAAKALPAKPVRSKYSGLHTSLRKSTDQSLYSSGLGEFPSRFFPPLYNRNSKFNLGGGICSQSFFTGVQLPDADYIVESQNTDAAQNHNKLIPSPAVSATETGTMAKACAMMDLQHRDHLLLYKSEVTVMRDNVGMVFWMGLKNT